MSSVRERRYRGICESDLTLFNSVIAKYNSLKDEMYKLVTDNIWMDTGDKKSTTRFLDDFFETVSNTKSWQKDFAYPCDKNGTGNVVIKGLKED